MFFFWVCHCAHNVAYMCVCCFDNMGCKVGGLVSTARGPGYPTTTVLQSLRVCCTTIFVVGCATFHKNDVS